MIAFITFQSKYHSKKFQLLIIEISMFLFTKFHYNLIQDFKFSVGIFLQHVLLIIF